MPRCASNRFPAGRYESAVKCAGILAHGADPAEPVASDAMCGRFTQRFTWREIVAYSRLSTPVPALNLRPRYNLAPSQNAAVLREANGVRGLAQFRWGLIPGWAKDPAIGHRLINARAESAATKPAFRAAFEKRRCLVPADGYYEWTGPRTARVPWLIVPRGGGLMAFAGLCARWRIPEDAPLRGVLAEHRPGDAVETFTILTTRASAALRPLHHRMPVVLPPEAFDAWLSGGEVALGPAPDDLLDALRVGTRVNSPRYDDPACVEPVASR